ncbi:hypothetical protein GCM10010124_10340 [Pilimelia terevasa]|uniref:Uncharacterized protein n=1 Tax=Pilimelia terevasa TaxID=53372 RepID=A0A8J3BLF5_9ACTN|nr:hypothetical protein [Pilimelia terevasa]GGK19666.1 hypothetical protein GCM10010124_10340 [Pilimelia terevasa]
MTKPRRTTPEDRSRAEHLREASAPARREAVRERAEAELRTLADAERQRERQAEVDRLQGIIDELRAAAADAERPPGPQ